MIKYIPGTICLTAAIFFLYLDRLGWGWFLAISFVLYMVAYEYEK